MDQSRPSRALTIVDRSFRIVLRLVPGAAIGASARDDAVVTVRTVCLAAAREGGWPGFIRTAVAEILAVLRAVAAARFGRRPPITQGPPARRPRRESSIVAIGKRIGRDFRQAGRALVAARGYASGATAMLALGIGINVAVLTILDSVLWRPVPFPDADRLAQLANFNAARGFTYGGFSRALIQTWRGQDDLVDAVEAYDRASFVYRTPAGAEMVAGAVVTPRLLSLLGVSARAGRVFIDGDGRAGTDRVVLVSETFWRKRMGGVPEAIGRELDLNGRAHRVIGVLPASFRFPEVRDLWTPYDLDSPPVDAPITPRMLVPVVRLARGLTFDRAAPEVTSRGGSLSVASGGSQGVSARLLRLGRSADEVTRRSLTLLGVAVGLLPVIICANVASLTLSRALDRTRDAAVRSALGATRADLVRARFIEHAFVGGIGSIGSLFVARGAIAAALAVMPDAMTATTLNAIDIDPRIVAVTALIGLVTILLFGLPSAWLGSRTSVWDALRRDTRTMTGGRAASRWREGLLVAQVSLSVVLLVAGAVLTRSLIHLQSIDRGFDATNLVVVTVGLPQTGYGDRAVRDRFARDAADRIQGLAGITGATIGGLPVELGAVNVGEIEFTDRPGVRSSQMLVPLFEVPPNYFGTLKVPILRGRPFREDDEPGSVVISQRFATRIADGRETIDMRFRFGDGAWLTVVGIAGDVRPLGDSETQPLAIYHPFGRESGAFRATLSTSLIADYRTFVVRAESPGSAVQAITAAIHALDPTVVIGKTALADHVFADAIARPRAMLLMIAVLGAAGLVTAAAGLYGVLAFLVSRRRREIGIRMALGARPRDVGRTVFGRGLALAATGMTLGLAASLVLGRGWRSLLYEIEPTDPLSLAAALVVVLATAATACWRPARSAMRVDPVRLLRDDE